MTAFNLENLIHLGVPAPLARELMNLSGDTQLTTISAGNATLAVGVATGQSLCVIVTTATGANAVTLRTATQMFNDIPGNATGFTYSIVLYNTGNGNATLTAGDAGTTITGSAVIPSGQSRTYVVTFPTATTMTLTNISNFAGSSSDVAVVGTTQLFPLASRIIAANGNVYMYGQAVTTVAQFDFVTMDVLGNITSLTAANVKAGRQIGVSQVAIAAASFAWVCISGTGLLGNVAASTQTSVPVIPQATTSGQVDTTSAVAAGVTTILGIQLLTTAGLTATALGVGLTSPVLKL